MELRLSKKMLGSKRPPTIFIMAFELDVESLDLSKSRRAALKSGLRWFWDRDKGIGESRGSSTEDTI